MMPTCFGAMPRRPCTSSFEATSENEKRALANLACTWAQAGLMSDSVFGSSCFVAAEPHFPHFPFGAGNAQSRRRDCGL